MNMAKFVHPYMMGIQPMVYIGVYSTGFCFVLFFPDSSEIALDFFNSYIPGRLWRQSRSGLLWLLGVEPQIILGNTNIIFGLIILVLGICLVSRHTGSQDRIVAISVSTLILWVIMSILKLMAMERLEFLQLTHITLS